jgi:hypothetical protein
MHFGWKSSFLNSLTEGDLQVQISKAAELVNILPLNKKVGAWACPVSTAWVVTK